MKEPENLLIQAMQRYSHAPEVVFDAWLNPDIVTQFMFSPETGEMVRCELEPRVGGSFIFTDLRHGKEVEHTGKYLAIDRPRHLKFTFGIPAESPDMDIVTVDIVPTANGCELTLTTEMKPQWAAYADRARKAWSNMLRGLEQALATV